MARLRTFLLPAVACFLLVLLDQQQCCHGFVLKPLLVHRTERTVHKLHRKQLERPLVSFLQRQSKDNDDDEDDGNNLGDSINVEQERKRLESLLMNNNSQNDRSNDNNTSSSSSSSSQIFLTLDFRKWKDELKHHPAPLLTSIGRERMETEITMLESLAESDDAIPELWQLWYQARGPKPAKDLMHTEALVAQGQYEGWAKAEELLRQIVATEGIHYVEPVNRLATLLFLQSRFDESLVLCEVVLQLKPWHFGALSGIVMVYQGLQENEKMLEWAKQRMPPLPKKGQEDKQQEQQMALGIESRQEWVDRMLDRARAALLRSEMGLEEAFMELDKQQKQLSSPNQQELSSSNSNNSNRNSNNKRVATKKDNNTNPRNGSNDQTTSDNNQQNSLTNNKQGKDAKPEIEEEDAWQ